MRTLLPVGLFVHPRTSIFTGMHQTTVGTHHHRSFARRPDFVQMLPHYLLAAGYNCSAINTDLNTDIDPDEWAAYQSNEAFLNPIGMG